MKNKNVSYYLLAIIIAATCLVGACDDKNYLLPDDGLKSSKASEAVSLPDCNFITTSSIELTEIEIEMLLFVREEEKMAHDVYDLLSKNFKKPIFSKIAESEAVHMEKVLCLLLHFNIDDPAYAEDGKFLNTEIQGMYNSLVALGSGSITDALTAGAIIEDFDISDISDWIALTENEAIINVFTNLICGSENHLVAFIEQLGSFDEGYDPDYISQVEFDAIISAGRQQCGF